MRSLVYFLILIASSFAFVCRANETQLGVIIGSISGLSAKYDLKNGRAVDGALSYSADGIYGLSFHTDYLINRTQQLSLGEIKPLNLYYGIGLRWIGIRTGVDQGKTKLGIRAPIGVNFQTSDPNLEIFAELAPVLDVAPSTNVYIDIGIGVRFRF